jgi:hypothetical protein
VECCQCRNRLRDGIRRRDSGPEASNPRYIPSNNYCALRSRFEPRFSCGLNLEMPQNQGKSFKSAAKILQRSHLATNRPEPAFWSFCMAGCVTRPVHQLRTGRHLSEKATTGLHWIAASAGSERRHRKRIAATCKSWPSARHALQSIVVERAGTASQC